MALKRKAADVASKDAKKLKAGGDIRNFFSSQGSSPPRRITRQDSVSRAAKKEKREESEKENQKEIGDANEETVAACTPPIKSSPAKSMLVKAVEEAKETIVPTVQTTIDAVAPEVVEDIKEAEKEKPELKSSKTSEEPLSKEEDEAKPKFDKKAWAEKNLSAEEMELLGLEIHTLDASWFEVLKDELKSKSFLDLKKFLMQEHKSGKTIFPPAEDVYSWSRHTPLSTVKAVILGQDPYHNHNQAHGLCFSVRPPTPAPPSLKNIYKALSIEYPDFKPPPNNGGLLTPWANRGVLMLNACLTVRAHEANSHANKGWERFTQRVIDIVAGGKKGVVFLAWGLPAGKRVAKVDKKRHLILTGVHPSPLSAHRGFFELGHFSKCNEWLEKKYGTGKGIDWSLDVDPEVAGL